MSVTFREFSCLQWSRMAVSILQNEHRGNFRLSDATGSFRALYKHGRLNFSVLSTTACLREYRNAKLPWIRTLEVLEKKTGNLFLNPLSRLFSMRLSKSGVQDWCAPKLNSIFICCLLKNKWRAEFRNCLPGCVYFLNFRTFWAGFQNRSLIVQ